MTPEQDLVAFLTQLFPSFRGLPPGEAEKRVEALGLYSAQAWAAGPDGLSKRGIPVPPQVHAPMAPIAPRVVAARSGGTTFLAQVRRGLGDAGFAQAITGFARVYAESLRQAPGAPAAAAPSPAAPARATGTHAVAGFEALIGGGLAAEPAPAAPAARPAPAPAPAPQPRPAPAPAPTRPAPSWGDLDLMPEGTDVGALGQGEAPPPPKKAEAPKRDYGGLDLLPEEEKPDEGGPVFEDPIAAAAASAPPPAAAAAADGPKKRASQVAPPSNAPPARSDEEPLEDDPVPSDPTLAALRRFERQGDPAALAEAQGLLEAELKSAPHAVAAAAATAGLARVELLRGRVPQAQGLAKDALARDPACPLAVEVLVRLGRGEAEQAGLVVAVAQLRDALDQRDPQKIRAIADRVRKQFPDEPHPYLGVFLAGKLTGNDKLAESGIKEAWRRFPGPKGATLTFGHGVDADLVDLLIAYGRECFNDKDGERLRRTVEGVDDKDNAIAGSLRMAVGLARLSLARPGVPRGTARRMTFAIARGLVGLQYFDAALPYIGKATGMGPTADESKAMSNERINAGALRRAFDRPGIKAQTGSYACVGARALSDSARQRLEAVRKDREAKEKEGFARGSELAAKARLDPALKREVTAAAQAAGVPDPFAAIDAAEAELLQIQRERQSAKEPQAAQAGGLFGKLKAAASAVGGAAKDQLLSMKEQSVTARRDEAARQLGLTLAQTLSDVTWKHPALQQAARELATIGAFLDYFEAEESKGKSDLGRLADAV